MPEAYVPLTVSFDTNTRVGGIDIVTDDVKKLSGHSPAPIEAFFASNRAALVG